ncbi:hypothetical protein BLOT_006606 [Blomia tropicalis]|nr:hypothetical protein BLOT_006606 [Blomia tropicalis]
MKEKKGKKEDRLTEFGRSLNIFSLTLSFKNDIQVGVGGGGGVYETNLPNKIKLQMSPNQYDTRNSLLMPIDAKTMATIRDGQSIVWTS